MRRGLFLLPGIALLLGLWMPVPSTGNAGLDSVVSEVRMRLPGWRVVHANAAWEGGYTVVASCGGRDLGFQLVPEHGLAVGDMWLQPDDAYTQSRLASVSDHATYLVWYRNPTAQRSLSCNTELARSTRAEGPIRPRD